MIHVSSSKKLLTFSIIYSFKLISVQKKPHSPAHRDNIKQTACVNISRVFEDGENSTHTINSFRLNESTVICSFFWWNTQKRFCTFFVDGGVDLKLISPFFAFRFFSWLDLNRPLYWSLFFAIDDLNRSKKKYSTAAFFRQNWVCFLEIKFP